MCAKRVLRWWQIKPGGKHPSLVEGLQWLQTLDKQVLLLLVLLLLFCMSSLVVLEALACICVWRTKAVNVWCSGTSHCLYQSKSCSHSYLSYSTSFSSLRHIEYLHHVERCKTIHQCCAICDCDTVSACQ